MASQQDSTCSRHLQTSDGSTTHNLDDDMTPIPTMAEPDHSPRPRFCIRCDSVFVVRICYDTIPGDLMAQQSDWRGHSGTKGLLNVLSHPLQTERAYPPTTRCCILGKPVIWRFSLLSWPPWPSAGQAAGDTVPTMCTHPHVAHTSMSCCYWSPYVLTNLVFSLFIVSLPLFV